MESKHSYIGRSRHVSWYELETTPHFAVFLLRDSFYILIMNTLTESQFM